MSTTYPDAIDPNANCENDAVFAIETTLGTNPQGTWATVAARLAQVDARITNAHIFKATDFGGVQQAIDAAFAAGGGIVLLPFGITTPTLNVTSGQFYTLKPGVSVSGFGAQSVIKVPDGAGDFVEVFGRAPGVMLDDVVLSNFVVDGNQAGNAPADVEAFAPIRDGNNNITGFNKPRMAIRVNGARITLTGLTVRGLDAINTLNVGGAQSAIYDCSVEAAGAFEHDCSLLYTSGGSGARIIGNRLGGNNIKRCAVETHNSDLFARENTIISCSTGFNVTGFVDDPLGTYAITCKDNHLLDVGEGIKLYSGVYGTTPDNQELADFIIADNIIRLNKTLWPTATVDKAIFYYGFNTKPVGQHIIHSNLIRAT